MPQRVEGSIEIEAPVETVYGYWETLENLPNFMANVEEVSPTGPALPAGGSRSLRQDARVGGPDHPEGAEQLYSMEQHLR